MEEKYTKGPWAVREAWDDDGYEVFPTRGGPPVDGGEWREIASVTETGIEGEALDNAHLIAAAPELLEALETLFGALCETPDGRSSVLRHVPMAMDMARAAIAKAHGGAK